MSINIKNREAEALLTRLAGASGKGKSELVLDLLREEAKRQAVLSEISQRKKKLDALTKRFSRRAADDRRTADEILGYGPDGLPR